MLRWCRAGRRPGPVPARGGRGGDDQPATVKRAQGDIERALGDPELGGELRGRNRPRMAAADRVENRLLALAQSVIRTTCHASAVPADEGVKKRGPGTRTACRSGAATLRRTHCTVNWSFGSVRAVRAGAA
jgi:hypothetical protein